MTMAHACTRTFRAGLAVNYMVIEAHGGRVEASTKGPGTGMRFQFTLPISKPAPNFVASPA
jgi:signal transduction histidine kinase